MLTVAVVMQALDGKVERDRAGKEVRYPVILTAKEKLIARAVSMAFKVQVMGVEMRQWR